jgi:Asp-tRNA(Asn)/Glu-tRNA(Gln) amidotransferase B subunit
MKLIDRIIASNTEMIKKQSNNVFGMIMGLVMKEVRGKANPEVVGTLVRKRLG